MFLQNYFIFVLAGAQWISKVILFVPLYIGLQIYKQREYNNFELSPCTEWRLYLFSHTEFKLKSSFLLHPELQVVTSASSILEWGLLPGFLYHAGISFLESEMFGSKEKFIQPQDNPDTQSVIISYFWTYFFQIVCHYCVKFILVLYIENFLFIKIFSPIFRSFFLLFLTQYFCGQKEGHQVYYILSHTANSEKNKIVSIMWQFGLKAEKAMAPHSSTLAWKIAWTEEPGRRQSMGLHRVEHD